MLQAIRERLTPEERRIVEFRQQGLEWFEIAEAVGDNPVPLRKRFSRALDRVSRELGLDEPEH